MTLIPQSTQIAARIEKINEQTISFLRSQAKNAYSLVTTEGEEQAILDVLGTNASEAVTVYGTLYNVLESLGEADGLTAPDPAVFVANEDGSITYVAPPEPEPEPEPEQDPAQELDPALEPTDQPE
jgi:peroxiredoxin